jgi:hypothetical protein
MAGARADAPPHYERIVREPLTPIAPSPEQPAPAGPTSRQDEASGYRQLESRHAIRRIDPP